MRSWRRQFLWMLIVCCSPAIARADEAELDWQPAKTHIFAVGVLEWQREDVFDSFPDCQQGRRDVPLMKSFLKAGVPRKQICYLQDRQATKSRLVTEFVKLLDGAGEGDLLIFYFCGHGYRDSESGKAWLANYDAAKDDDTGWLMSDVLDRIERHFRGERALLLVDCCHSGAMCDEAERRGETRVDYAILTSACTHNTATSHWTYTESLLTALRGEAVADLNDDGCIELSEVAHYTELELAFVEERKSMFLTTGGFTDLTRLTTVNDSLTPGVGARVEVYSDDDWFRAKTIAVAGGRTRVHFVDYDDSYDEWVAADKIRPFQPPQYAEGDRVEARWKNGDDWSAARVLQSFYGLTQVHYDSNDDGDFDEWLGPNAVRLPTD